MEQKQTSVGNMPYIARTKSEKAKARRLAARGLVTLDGMHETYISRGRIISYEALHVSPRSQPQR